IATVSHIINKTRFVRPELVAAVEQAIKDTGYEIKQKDTGSVIFSCRDRIAVVVPEIDNSIFADIICRLEPEIRKNGFIMSVFITDNSHDIEKEILTSILTDKNIVGIILIPSKKKSVFYNKLSRSRKPVVCIFRNIINSALPMVLCDDEHSVYKGVKYLIRNGHTLIGLVYLDRESGCIDECMKGYCSAVMEAGLKTEEKYMIRVPQHQNNTKILGRFAKSTMPTAFITIGNALSGRLMQEINELGMKCPQDISVIAYGNNGFNDTMMLNYSSLIIDVKTLAEKAVDILMKEMNGIPFEMPVERIRTDFRIRETTRVINTGPFGERAYDPEELFISDEEKMTLIRAKYKVALSFQNTKTYWSILQERAIRETLSQYGVQVISAMDANYDPKLQIAELNAIEDQAPDALIGIPVDEDVTSERFKTISRKMKVILIGNLPKGFDQSDYYSCVSINEKENGRNAAAILGEYFKDDKVANIGLIVYGKSYRMTNTRDIGAEQAIVNDYPNLKIIAKKEFPRIKDVYELTREMVEEHPDINGIYISWETPALEAIRALEDMGRTDISVSTVDLDAKIAEYMSKDMMVRGLSAQKPYEQGRAAAMVTLLALLGKKYYRYVEIQPVAVRPRELTWMWQKILAEPYPEYMK
ncbi:MAG: LacI family DNA-binding transcriptional regulator, partial [Parasporobacterium sp.]|nr:LacI family DNA-binding transcriptional regulator [Parasporobacterium sp.]